MTRAGVVIAGAGHGALSTASSLRSAGYEGPVTIVARETHLPYQRPPLSKDLLAGDVDADGVALRPESFYAKKALDLRRGDGVAEIDRAAGRVRLASGEAIPYASLVLATGARTRPLPVGGTELEGVCELRSLDDACELRDGLAAARSVVVVGGGFIGLEVAAAARRAGARVTVLEALGRTMARVVSETISAHVAAVHEAHGTEVRHGVRVLALAGDGAGRVAGVELEGGEVVEADLVVLGVGIAPNVELAAQAGLAVDDGIEVDGRLRTSDERIWAVGDCARFPLPGGTRVRLESVQNATDHGRTAAAAILGATEPYAALPWFWSHQHECRLQIAGLCAGHDETVLRGERASGSFSVFCFEGPRLAAVESVNAPRDHMAARRLLEAGVALAPEQAADPGCDLKALDAI